MVTGDMNDKDSLLEATRGAHGVFIFTDFYVTSKQEDEIRQVDSSSKLLPPATKLGQGYIFTDVCDSVNTGCASSRGCFLQRGRFLPGGECFLPGEGASSRGGGCFPPGRLLLRVVRILLECILVSYEALF